MRNTGKTCENQYGKFLYITHSQYIVAYFYWLFLECMLTCSGPKISLVEVSEWVQECWNEFAQSCCLSKTHVIHSHVHPATNTHTSLHHSSSTRSCRLLESAGEGELESCGLPSYSWFKVDGVFKCTSYRNNALKAFKVFGQFAY